MMLTSLAVFALSLSFYDVVNDETYLNRPLNQERYLLGDVDVSGPQYLHYSFDFQVDESILSNQVYTLSLNYNQQFSNKINFNFTTNWTSTSHTTHLYVDSNILSNFNVGFTYVAKLQYLYDDIYFKTYFSPQYTLTTTDYAALYDTGFNQTFINDNEYYGDFVVSVDVYLQLISNIDFDDTDNAYANGFNTGYDNGYDNGYQDGYNDGNTSGYDEGYNNGYQSGNVNGYNNGYNTALSTHSFSFTNLFASISDTPILMIRRLFGFELFGVSLISVFMSLFTALIVIHVIKKVF